MFTTTWRRKIGRFKWKYEFRWANATDRRRGYYVSGIIVNRWFKFSGTDASIYAAILLATMKKKPLRVLFSLFCVRSLLLAYRCLCVSTYFSISHLNIIYIYIHTYEEKKMTWWRHFFVFSICLYFFFVCIWGWCVQE